MISLYIMTGFLIGFPLFWCGVVFLISRWGGWASLASHYAYSGVPKRQRKFKSLSLVRLRFFPCNYSMIIHLGADDQALYLSVTKLFTFGHAPLRIPFRELSISRQGSGLFILGHVATSKTGDLKIALQANDMDWLRAKLEGSSKN